MNILFHFPGIGIEIFLREFNPDRFTRVLGSCSRSWFPSGISRQGEGFDKRKYLARETFEVVATAFISYWKHKFPDQF